MTQFKVGDKVRYKESEKRNAGYNGHDFSKIYTVERLGSATVVFFVESPDQGAYSHRLELAEPTEQTFDYKQALKILAENPGIELELAVESVNLWTPVDAGGILYINTRTDVIYRIKPAAKPTYHWLIKSKGKFAVTSGKYASEEDVKAGYSYPVEVIQKLED